MFARIFLTASTIGNSLALIHFREILNTLGDVDRAIVFATFVLQINIVAAISAIIGSVIEFFFFPEF